MNENDTCCEKTDLSWRWGFGFNNGEPTLAIYEMRCRHCHALWVFDKADTTCPVTAIYDGGGMLNLRIRVARRQQVAHGTH